ncbi:porin [Solemya velum gill symbiont]|uniref:porin n=1 Tax=Solemya velum gill symbiont TaxID=2340 RepID=UPI00227F1F12|nr:porin [Solemya velum gill symbiont]
MAVAVAAPAANAGVTIYGKVHVSVDFTESGDDSVWAVKSRASRIGFKGTEDLGNGLSLVWKAETSYDFADGGAFGGGRNAYIGLTGDWGTFLYGRHDTPYKMAYYATGIDMMSDTTIDMNTLSGSGDIYFNQVRASNAIAYVSPNMNGLTFAGAIVPGEGSAAGDGLNDLYSVSAMYSNEGLKLAVAYENLEGDSGTFGSDNDWWDEKILIGGSYTMNDMTIALAYQDGEFAGTSTEALGLAFGYKFGNNKLVANYRYLEAEGYDVVDSWGIGLNHSLSKRSSAYVAYASHSLDSDIFVDNIDVDQFSVGMIHNF